MLLLTIFTTLAGVGATIIVTTSYLFRPLQRFFRNEYLYKLFNCPICYGFWQGLAFQTLIIIFDSVRMDLHPWLVWEDLIIIFFQGCITSIASYIVYLIMIKLGHDKL